MALEDYNILKAMTKDQLYDMVPSNFEFQKKPWIHQLASFIASIANDKFFLALDLGTGKTKISIDTFRYFQMMYGRMNVLVLCLNAAVENWVQEIEMHASGEFTSVGLKKFSKKEKTELILGQDYNIKVISFETFRSLFVKRVPGEKGKRVEILSDEIINKVLAAGYNGIIIDESHKVKNHKALIFQLCDIISQQIRFRYNLTGTPFHKLMDMWTQYYILDRGKTFGDNFFLFRQKYFENKKLFVKRLGYEMDNWVVTSFGKQEITRKMYSLAIRYDESEIKDMPGKNYRVIRYPLSPAQRKSYDALTNDDKLMKVMGKNKSMIFRQICSGFILKTGEVFKQNPKLDACWELIEQIKDFDKIVIFHYFDKEYEDIAAKLKKKKVPYIAINGGTKDTWKVQKDFEFNDKIRVAIVNIKAGSASINLQTARYTFFYSNDPSIINRKQAIKRTHRGEIKRTRHYYDFVGIKTVEVYMFNSLSKGISVFDEVMSGQAFRKALMGEM
jgi:SNF2 family DNA or RNA helicase